MSNSGTDVFINIPALSGSVIARTRSEKRLVVYLPEKDQITGHRFAITPYPVTKQALATAVGRQKIIKNFAEQGDCIITGCCADVILKDYNQLNIFVYASMDTKLKRCIGRAPKDGNLNYTELEQKIQKVDKERTKYFMI